MTDENGNFIITGLNVASSGWVKITVQKDGYTKFEKVINYKDPKELKDLSLQAVLDRPETKVIQVNQQLNLQSTSEDEFVTVAVVKDITTGKQEVLSGQELKYQLRKNSNLITVWQLDINKQLLKQQNTDTLIATIKNYDPSKQEDMKRFPAENDDKGNKLVSAGFDFVNIVDQNGKTFELKKTTTSSQSVKTNALPTNYRLIRFVNKALIKCDENPNKPGTQIGFYWFTNNSWVKIGEATIYSDSTPDATPIEFKDIGNSNGNLYAVLTDNDIDKSALPMDRYYNLDYVTTSCGAPQELTLRLNVTDDKGNPLSTFGYYYDGGFYSFVISNRDNKITIPNGGNFDPTKLIIDNPYDWSSILASDKDKCSVNNNTVTCKITNPYSATLSGKLIDEKGNPIANRYVYTSQGRYAMTGSDGTFSLVAKSGSLCIYAYPKIDALACVDVSEKDNKNLGNLTYKNSPPVVYLYANTYVVNQGGNVNIYSYVYDPDYDQYNIKFSSDCGGTFTPSDTNQSNPTTWTAPNTAGECKITLTATDSNGGKTEKTIAITVKSPEDSIVISNITTSATTVDFGGTVSLSAVVLYYGTGAPTYKWSDDCGGTFTPSDKTLTTWKAPNTTSECNITFTVSNGTISKTKQLKIVVGKTAYGNIKIQRKN